MSSYLPNISLSYHCHQTVLLSEKSYLARTRWSVHIITISVCNNDNDDDDGSINDGDDDDDVDCGGLLNAEEDGDDGVGEQEDVDLKSDELLVDEEVVDLPDVDPQLHLGIHHLQLSWLL